MPESTIGLQTVPFDAPHTYVSTEMIIKGSKLGQKLQWPHICCDGMTREYPTTLVVNTEPDFHVSW
jgi:hypothetical protein